MNDIAIMPLSDLKPAEYNPRKDLQPGDPAYESLKESIKKYGQAQAIVWNRRSGNIIGGHQTYKILRQLGYTEAKVCVMDLSDSEEKALNIALNKIDGSWDEDKLKSLFEELQEAGEEAVTGFDDLEIEELLDDVRQNQISMISELLNEDFITKESAPDCFSLSLIFNISDREDIEEFIRDNGKAPFVEAILNLVKGESNA